MISAVESVLQSPILEVIKSSRQLSERIRPILSNDGCWVPFHTLVLGLKISFAMAMIPHRGGVSPIYLSMLVGNFL